MFKSSSSIGWIYQRRGIYISSYYGIKVGIDCNYEFKDSELRPGRSRYSATG